MMPINLVLPYLPPASYSRNSRASYWKRSADRNALQGDLQVLLIEAGWDGKVIERPRIRVKFVLNRQRRDHDNLITRFKSCLDCLTNLGVLRDDSLQEIGWPQYSHEYGKPQRTVIRIDGR